MKFESQILACLFVACFAVCALVVGSMLSVSPATAQLADAAQLIATQVG